MHKFSFYLCCIFFRVILDFSYVTVISDLFEYAGFKYSFYNMNYIISWFIFILSLFVVKDRLLRVSDYFFLTALLGVIAPLSSLFGLDSDRAMYPLIVTFLSILFIFVFLSSKTISFKRLKTIKDGNKIAIAISLLFVCFLVFWYFKTGVSLNLDLSKVYQYRNENAELSSGGILAYTNTWTYQIFNIYLLAIFLFRKNFLLVAVILIIQIFFFAASTHKSILFYPVILLGLWYYFSKSTSAIVIPLSFSLIVCLGLLTYNVYGDVWVSSLFIRRVFYVPANLTYVYFDFFNNNDLIFWSNSILSFLIDYPYNDTVSHVIGQYLGEKDLGANNGFVSSGYGHAGLLGVFIYSIILAFTLKLINDVSLNRCPPWLSIGITFVPIRALLISSDLFTVMLTHGFIIAILLILFTQVSYEKTY